MELIKCGQCGRPYYDKEKACPYCGHALGSLPTTPDRNAETENNNPKYEDNPQKNESINVATEDASASSNISQVRPQFSTRADTIAAITATEPGADGDAEIEDPNQTETTLPPRRRHTWPWIVVVLILVAAAAACIYFGINIK